MATNVYSDIDGRYIRNIQTSDLTKNIDTEAIRNSVKNILLSRKMERRMIPEFGASLDQLLFEPMDEITAKKIGSVMIEELTYWEPRIVVTGITVTMDEDNLQYDIILNYYIQSTNSQDSLSFILQ